MDIFDIRAIDVFLASDIGEDVITHLGWNLKRVNDIAESLRKEAREALSAQDRKDIARNKARMTRAKDHKA